MGAAEAPAGAVIGSLRAPVNTTPRGAVADLDRLWATAAPWARATA